MVVFKEHEEVVEVDEGKSFERLTLTVKEASEMMGISGNTLYTEVREGNIKHLRIRGKILFSRKVIEAMINGEEVN